MNGFMIGLASFKGVPLTGHLLQKPFVCPAPQLHVRGPIREAVGHIYTELESPELNDKVLATHKHQGST